MIYSQNLEGVKKWCEDTIAGRVLQNKEGIQACERFLKDLKDDRWEFKSRIAEICCRLIESTIRHIKGPKRGQLLKLEMWQRFCVYNIAGFYIAGTNRRRFTEAFIFVPRKNGKTTFAAGLAWAIGIIDRQFYSLVSIVATKLDRALESFKVIKDNLKPMGEFENCKIRDNNAEHSIRREFADGEMEIQALAADTERADGINGNIFILDEIHAYKKADDYLVYKEAAKAYDNKLIIGITTAGKNINSFCYSRLQYCLKVLAGQIGDETYFIYIRRADDLDDYTNPVEHEKANPSYGVTIKPEDIMSDALQAQNDPSTRNAFLQKSLNIYVNAMNAYFDVPLLQESNKQHSWTLEELAKLPITWYGGADLSKMYDLTGVSIHGRYKGVDISITHGFMPVTAAHEKAEKDNIPLFWWEEQGWLTLCNSEVIEYEDVVQWFLEMKRKGFKPKCVGYDRRYSKKFVLKMKKAGFKMKDQSQRYVEKTEAFREIEKQIKMQKFYYLGNKAYEYCVGNVKAIEDSDDFVRYKKIMPTQRIDLFDADVIAVKQMLNAQEDKAKAEQWIG